MNYGGFVGPYKHEGFMKKVLFSMAVALMAALTAGQAQTIVPRTSVRCLGVELDGSETLRVQGYGRNRADAKEQAMKNAVWAVIFDGVIDGAEGCNMRPLVTEANAREHYQEYFDRFFADNGPYKEYVSLRDTKKRSGGKAKNKTGYSYDLTVRVLRSELEARLRHDNVIE